MHKQLKLFMDVPINNSSIFLQDTSNNALYVLKQYYHFIFDLGE